MFLNSDDRRNKRDKHESMIMIEDASKVYSYGTMYNIGPECMYFESDYAPRLNSKISIRIENPPFKSVRVYSATTRWSRILDDIDDMESSYVYGVGVKFT